MATDSTISSFKLKNPIPPHGQYCFEKGFSEANLNVNLEAEIEKVKSFIKCNSTFLQAGEAYILCLRNKISQNTFLLNKKYDRIPEFSAIYCVRFGDLNGLQLLVANRENVNQQDERRRTALHFAAAAPEKIDYLKTLLLHPEIDTTIHTKLGKLAIDLVEDVNCKSFFPNHNESRKA